MARLPVGLQPLFLLRRQAIFRGILGGSNFWRLIGIVLLSRRTLKNFFGKKPDRLGTWKVGTNRFVNVISAQPVSRKERKRSGTSKKAMRAAIIAQAVADARKKNPNAKIVVKSK